MQLIPTRGLDVIDAMPKAEIRTTREVLQVHMQKLEDAGRAPQLQDSLPWAVSAITLFISAHQQYSSPDQDNLAIALASGFAVAGCFMLVMALNHLSRGIAQYWKDKVSVDTVLDDIENMHNG